MEIELVIWDCDGVLVDSEWLGAQAFMEIIGDHGGSVSVEYVYNSIKGGSIQKSLDFVAKHMLEIPSFDVEKVYRERTDELFETELKQIEGVDEVLQTLKTKKCVASNGPLNKIIRNLEITNLKKYFRDDALFSAHSDMIFKPEPDLFLRAAAVMGVNPKNCIVIEDSIHGAEAARRAGMKCYGYNAPNITPADFVSQQAISFHHMTELISHLSLF